MTTLAPPSLLNEALDYLTGLAADAADPSTARRRLNDLRERHPGVRWRVLWQREAYDGSLQYDLLLTRPGDGTISLAYCPERALPWPLRGGHRASERLLLRVNGVAMELDQAIACLDFLWDEAALAERLVTACLLRQELEEAPVELGAEELQWAMDAFRRARGLLTAAATTEWMASRGLSHRDLEALVADEAAVARLRTREIAGRMPAYFEEHRLGLATARIARLVFPERTDAQRVVEEVRAGGDFYAAAERSFAEGLISASPKLFDVVRRDELGPDVAACLFDAPPGAALGPIPTEGGYAVIRILAIEDPVLDEATIELVERRLFAEWLDARRRSARVEWFWGSAARTSGGRTPRPDVNEGWSP